MGSWIMGSWQNLFQQLSGKIGEIFQSDLSDIALFIQIIARRKQGPLVVWKE